MKFNWRRVALVVTLSLIAGCSPAAPHSVPTVATSPYVCDGVPLEGVVDLLGKVTVTTHGAWGRDGAGFGCTVDSASRDKRFIMISERPGGVLSESDDEQVERQEILKQADPQAIAAPYPGFGFLYGSAPDDPTAVWVCNGRELLVEPFGFDPTSPRLRTDVEHLLISMLPWTCGIAPAPTVGSS